jgi:hypothetical protein
LIADQKTRKIICTAFDKGRKHDFRLFKQSKTYIQETIRCKADTGYQGIAKRHSNSETPKKRSKKAPLTKAEKKHNHLLAAARVTIEHIIREVKIFRILAEKYRNRRKKFGLRFNLIAAIYNFNLNYL